MRSSVQQQRAAENEQQRAQQRAAENAQQRAVENAQQRAENAQQRCTSDEHEHLLRSTAARCARVWTSKVISMSY